MTHSYSWQLRVHIGKDGKRDHQFESVVSKNNIFQILFCIYIPVINAVILNQWLEHQMKPNAYCYYGYINSIIL